MKQNVMILNCSPRGEKGSSYAIAAYFKQCIEQFGYQSVLLSLAKERENAQNLFSKMSLSDVLILSVPVYENMVPGMLMRFFEEAYVSREQFGNKARRIFVITNSGFAAVQASQSTVAICKAFSKAMRFEWLGGAAVAPGTLIEQGDLIASAKTYRKLIEAICLISQSIVQNRQIPEQAFQMLSKTFISNRVYRFAGYLIQKKEMKRLGKARYYAKPMVR